MAITDFIQANKITALAVELVRKQAVYQSFMRVTNQNARSIDVPKYNGSTMRDYVPGSPLTIDVAGSTKVTIDIDQGKYMNELIDRVENANKAQEILPQILQSMANNSIEVQETHALSTLYAGATITDATGLGVTTAPITIATEANAIAYMKALRVAIMKNSIMLSDAFVVLPPEIEAIVYDTVVSRDTNNSIKLATGQLGTYGGIDIYSSNFLPAPAASERAVIAGSKKASDFIFSYNNFESDKGGVEWEGDYWRMVMKYGAGANNGALLIKGVVAEA